MKKNIITTILGLALLTVAPSVAKESTSSQSEQTTRPTEVRLLDTPSSSTVLTHSHDDVPTRTQRPKLQKVKDVPFRPHGRSRFDKAPEAKSLIYVDGFENQWD